MRVRSAFALVAVLAPAAPLLAQGGPPPPPPPPVVQIPPGNPITFEKTQLGKALFWEEQLASTRTVSCGSCHMPEAGGSDVRSRTAFGATNPGPDGVFGTQDDIIGSPGVILSEADGTYDHEDDFGLAPQVTGRKANSAINAAFAPSLFWDGRADASFEDPVTGAPVFPDRAALESQVAGPPVNDVEMGHLGRDWNDVAARVASSEPLALAESVPASLAAWIAGRSYPELFDDAFGSPAVTPTRIAMAIATYERSLISMQAPIDQFLNGNPNALTPQEQQGFNIFNNPAVGCRACHGGPLFTNQQFRYIGVRPQAEDLGRFAVTGNNQDRGAMRVPSLRNVGLREPYFHNGGMSSLEEVVAFYDRGGDFDGPNLPPQIRPLGLNPQERNALVAFLRNALTDTRVEQSLPPFDRPTLYEESSHVPEPFGLGTAGTGGFVPRIVAIEPPKLGNPDLTIGVEGGLGGAQAILAISPYPDPVGSLRKGATLHLGLSAQSLRRHGPLEGAGAGAGFGSLTIALPDDAALAGTSWYAQWIVLDPGAPQGVATSQAVELPLW